MAMDIEAVVDGGVGGRDVYVTAPKGQLFYFGVTAFLFTANSRKSISTRVNTGPQSPGVGCR